MLSVADGVWERLSRAGVPATLINARFVKPLDMETIGRYLPLASKVVTIEDNAVRGGFGSLVEHTIGRAVIKFGWGDEFIPHGGIDELRERYGLTADKIFEEIRVV